MADQMCGILGSFLVSGGQPVATVEFDSSLDRLAHRGPDDEGRYAKGRARLGHRRLSVIDTSAAGHQPFTDASGRYTIVFNGEVFNFRELRTEMERTGQVFRSGTDTEVVIELFMRKGAACLQELNGFFAFAVHDALKDQLFLARDRYGVKPLCWAEHGGNLLFSSELRSILAMGAEAMPDAASARQFLGFCYTPAPFTTVKNIHKLMPGHMLHASREGIQVDRWYNLAEASKRIPVSTSPVRELQVLMDDAVKRRLVADVPIGSFLSGGIDSSIVSALAARHHNGLHTFSIGYADDPYFDETRYAEEVARHIGSEHHTFRLEREELADGYLRLLRTLDEPFADSSALPSFILCERTREHVTVALSGDGADEVFGGYSKHQAELRWRNPGVMERAVRLLAPLWSALPKSRNSTWQNRVRQLDRFARLASGDPAHRSLELASFTPVGTASNLVAGLPDKQELQERSAMLTAPLSAMPGMNGVLLADISSTLPNDMLHKVDLTSMAHGLEVRPPFLDYRVVEFAFSLPAEMKLRKGSGKHILREAFGTLLPPKVMKRSKKGFEVPLLELLRGPLSSLVDELLSADHVRHAGLDPALTAEVVERMRSNAPGTSQATVHALLVYTWWWGNRTHG